MNRKISLTMAGARNFPCQKRITKIIIISVFDLFPAAFVNLERLPTSCKKSCKIDSNCIKISREMNTGKLYPGLTLLGKRRLKPIEYFCGFSPKIARIHAKYRKMNAFQRVSLPGSVQNDVQKLLKIAKSAKIRENPRSVPYENARKFEF